MTPTNACRLKFLHAVHNRCECIDGEASKLCPDSMLNSIEKLLRSENDD